MTLGRAHINSSHIHCVVSAEQGHLQLEVALVVLGLVGNLGDELLLVSPGRCLLLNLALGGDTGVEINLGGAVDGQALRAVSVHLG